MKHRAIPPVLVSPARRHAGRARKRCGVGAQRGAVGPGMSSACALAAALAASVWVIGCAGNGAKQQPALTGAGRGGANPASGVTTEATAGTKGAGTAAGSGADAAGAAPAAASDAGSAAEASRTGAAGAGTTAVDTSVAGTNAASTGATAGAGAAAAGGSAATSGAAGTAGSPTDTGSCGSGARNDSPFGCKFAFGENDPGGSLSALSALGFVSKWVGYEVDKSGTLAQCDGCSWLSQQVAPTALVPVYYAYFIGYFGHANGFMDGNQDPNGPNLTTDGAQLIREHRQQIVDMYAWYARQSAAVWKDKPLLWLLEGDFVQYAGDSQKQPLSWDELGALSRDLTCAIKSNMPNAVVAINHSTWNPDETTRQFWNAMADIDYDLVWTTGVPNNAGYFEAGTDASSYNAATASYAFVHQLTGRNILVDTSFGLSGMSDSWSGAGVDIIDQRIADGVIAVNVSMPDNSYPATVAALTPKLAPVCK